MKKNLIISLLEEVKKDFEKLPIARFKFNFFDVLIKLKSFGDSEIDKKISELPFDVILYKILEFIYFDSLMEKFFLIFKDEIRKSIEKPIMKK